MIHARTTFITHKIYTTLSSPLVSNGYASKCSGHNVKKLKMVGGLDQYGAERFGRLIFATIRKSVGTKKVKRVTE